MLETLKNLTVVEEAAVDNKRKGSEDQDSEPKKQRSDDESDEVDKDKRTLFVRNLPFSVNEEQVNKDLKYKKNMPRKLFDLSPFFQKYSLLYF